MAEPISIQQLKDASEDAITLADFIYKPANVMIPRRLAADINSLQYYLDYMSAYAQHSYETYDEMVANAVNLPNGVSAFVTNDLDTAKNGMYTYNGSSFVKGLYQPEKAAIDYVEAKLGGLEVFNGKVRAQDVSTMNGSTQEEVNKKTIYVYDTVAAMLADTTIVSGKVVSTNGYHDKQDGGGAKYTISLTPTDYSIPLANDLHAVFNDSFDIRKFGIRDSATLNQDVELLRMRNYADTREYVIDFHGFSIMSPKLNPNISGSAAFDTVRGLWFTKAHHFKNLKIFSDKVNRQNTGICQLIFCPDVDPANEEWVVFENITLDPWSDNYQPFTEDYAGQYDGMRHGIFIHPKGGWNALFNVNQKDYATNYCFKFINIEFLSSAYSYNITTAGVRSRKVIIDGYKGDSILAFNTDNVSLQARNFTTNTRYDLVESGRQMVLSGIHYEAEHSGVDKNGLVFNHDLIQLENCNITRVTKEGVNQNSGQLLWFTAIGKSDIKDIRIANSFGNIELQGIPNTTLETSGLHCGYIQLKDCRNHINIVLARGVVADNVEIDNCVIKSKVAPNSLYSMMLSDSSIGLLKIHNNSVIAKSLTHYSTQTSSIDKLEIDNVGFELPQTGTYAYFEQIKIRDISIRNVHYSVARGIFRRLMDVSVARFSNVVFEKANDIAILTFVYTQPTGKTKLYLDNIRFENNISIYTIFALAGDVYVNGLYSPNILPTIKQPQDVAGEFTAGINVVTAELRNVKADAALNKTYTLTDTVAANSTVKKTYPVNKDCKYAALSLSLPTDLAVSQYRQGDNIVITLANNTSSPISLASNILTVKQII